MPASLSDRPLPPSLQGGGKGGRNGTLWGGVTYIPVDCGLWGCEVKCFLIVYGARRAMTWVMSGGDMPDVSDLTLLHLCGMQHTRDNWVPEMARRQNIVCPLATRCQCTVVEASNDVPSTWWVIRDS